MMRTHRPSRRALRREVGLAEPVPTSFASIRELGLLGLFLLLLNLPVFFGGVNPFTFDLGSIANGGWWRIVTHPFTHVSPYHFLLDGIAFVSLWAAISGTVWRRIALTAASAAGALLLSLALSPQIREVGLCGLSGVAHGLIIAVAVDAALRLPRQDGMRLVSAATVLVVFGKVVYELSNGALAFGFMHRGALGVPIVECHAGGAAGAAALLLIELLRRYRGNACAPTLLAGLPARGWRSPFAGSRSSGSLP